jgi:hypothetical protein
LASAFRTLASKGVDKKSALLSDGVHVAHRSKSAMTTNISKICPNNATGYKANLSFAAEMFQYL